MEVGEKIRGSEQELVLLEYRVHVCLNRSVCQLALALALQPEKSRDI